jgi:integrase
MPHHLLKAAQIARLAEEPGKHGDGAGLFLHVHKPGQASWGYKFRLNGQTLWGSIGPARLYTLAQARDRHAALCRIIKEEKRDPRKLAITAGASLAVAGEPAGESLAELLVRYLVKTAPLFKEGKALGLGELSTAKLEEKIREGKAGKEACSYYRNFDRLDATMKRTPAAAINPLAYRNAVEAIWPDKKPTTERMIKRLGTLLEFQRSGKTSKAEHKVVNHPAMPYRDVAAFMGKLASGTTVGARTLQWTILTAARASETLEATWGEIGEEDGAPVWRLSRERMKADEPHIVPLTSEMLAILGPREADDQPLFRGGAGGFPNAGVMWQLMKRARLPYVPHGFRTSFRSWAGDCTDFPREIAEKAIAHAVPGVEGDYDRGDKLAKRRALMEAWCAFALSA